MGGKRSDVKLADGAATAFQHDATVLANGTISVFDNGGVPKVHPQSRGDRAVGQPARAHRHGARPATSTPPRCPPAARAACSRWPTATCSSAGARSHTSPNSAPPERCCSTAHWHGSYQSYRAYRFPWTGTPAERARDRRRPGASAERTDDASTRAGTARPQVASWRVLAGPSPAQLAPVATRRRSGFETAIATPGPEPYVAVQALEQRRRGTRHLIDDQGLTCPREL